MYCERLKYQRELKELSQNDIAKKLGIDRSLYTHYENEYYIMPTKYLNVLCNHFNISLDYLFEFKDDTSYKIVREEIDKNLSGKRLKEFRKENNLTQVKLANILKTTQSTIAEYERGTNIIATPFLYMICSNYNISADYLIGRIDSPKYWK